MHPGHWWEKEEPAALSNTNLTNEKTAWRASPPSEKELRDNNRKMRARGSHHNHKRRKNKMPR